MEINALEEQADNAKAALTWSDGKGRPTARRRGGPIIPAEPSWEPELGL